MSPQMRSLLMGRIKGRNTTPERTIFAALEQCGVSFVRHFSELPGRPDVVFPEAKLAVFIDGDFWHGWRFPLWQHKLTEKWRNKIEATRRRDKRNFRRLRQCGWKVLRLWEHQIESNPAKCLNKVMAALEASYAVHAVAHIDSTGTRFITASTSGVLAARKQRDASRVDKRHSR